MTTAPAQTTDPARALLIAARAGDENAFSSWSSHAAASSMPTATACSPRVHDAEDALQETLLRAWRGLEAFEERSSLRSWFFRIATNVCLT